MKRFWKTIGWCLLVLWLPVTQHCRLEALELLGERGCDTACHSPASGSVDQCDVIENGLYKSTVFSLQVVVPESSLDTFFTSLLLSPLQPDPGLRTKTAGEIAQPRDWLVNWQFVQRTALPARAPDSVA